MLLRIRQKLRRAPRHSLHVPHREQVAGLAVSNQLGEPFRRGGDHRHACRHRLEGRETEALVLAGQDEEVRDREHVLDRVELTQPADPFRHPQLIRQLPGGHAIRSVPHEEEPARDLAPHRGEDPDHVGHALAHPEVRDVEEHALPFPREPLLGTRSVPPRCELRRVHEIGDDLDGTVQLENLQRLLT